MRSLFPAYIAAVVFGSSGEMCGRVEEYGLPECTAYYLYKYQGREYSVRYKADGTVLIMG